MRWTVVALARSECLERGASRTRGRENALDGHTLLLHGVAVADRHALVLERVKVDSETHGRADLVLAAIPTTDTAGHVVVHARAVRQVFKELLCDLGEWFLLDERKHSEAVRRDLWVETQHRTLAAKYLFFIVRIQQHREQHATEAQSRLHDVRQELFLSYRVLVHQTLATRIHVLLQVIVRAVRDAPQLAPAKRILELDIGSRTCVVSELFLGMFVLADILGLDTVLEKEFITLLDPVLVPLVRLVRVREELELELLELTRTEQEMARRDLVPEALAHLANAERKLLSHGTLHVAKVDVRTLGRLRTQVDPVARLLRRAHVGTEQQIELLGWLERVDFAAAWARNRMLLEQRVHLLEAHGRNRLLLFLGRQLGFQELVHTHTRVAVGAHGHRVREIVDVARRRPHGRVHEHGRVQTDTVGTLLHELEPPPVLDVLLHERAQRSIVKAVGQAAVDLRAWVHEAAVATQRDQLLLEIARRCCRRCLLAGEEPTLHAIARRSHGDALHGRDGRRSALFAAEMQSMRPLSAAGSLRSVRPTAPNAIDATFVRLSNIQTTLYRSFGSQSRGTTLPRKMVMQRVERVVLELLVTRRDLDSADGWRHALRVALTSAEEGVLEVQGEGATELEMPLILEAVASIVPHLSDYKTFYENVCSLLKFCEQECSHELFTLVCQWMSSMTATTTVAFKTWLYAYVEDVSQRMIKVDPLKWKQTLLLATLKEEDATLKRRLLQLIDRNIGSLDGLVPAQDSPPSQQLRLLSFYWQHAAELSQSTPLCAAKFSGITASHTTDIEAVVTFLRWARVLEPLFFENFTKLVVEMKIFARIRERDLQLLPAVGDFIHHTLHHQTPVLRRLQRSQVRIREAFEKNALHVQLPSGSTSESVLSTVPPVHSRPEGASAYLAHDLSLLPEGVFPHALAVYVLVGTSILEQASSEGASLDSAVEYIQGLLSVAALRSDTSSLFFVLAAVIDLRLASHRVWLHEPQLFEQTIEDLSEQFILESNKAKKWSQQILLFQLLLECNVDLLAPRREWLAQRLPASIYRIAVHRCGP